MTNQSGTCYHVRGLEEALTLYARDRLAGKFNPTFTIEESQYNDKLMSKTSYQIEARRGDGSTAILRAVLLHITPVGPDDARGIDPKSTL